MTYRLPPKLLPLDVTDEDLRYYLEYLMTHTGYSPETCIKAAAMYLAMICESAWVESNLPSDRFPVITNISFKRPENGSDSTTG